MRLRKFEDHLHDKLQDPGYAAAYLKAAAEDGTEELGHALREIASAQEGGTQHDPTNPSQSPA